MDVKHKTMRKLRICFFIGGLSLISFGITLSILSNFGVGAWDTVTIGLKKHFGLTIGIWMNICAIGFIFLGGLLNKKRPKFECFITSLIVGIGVDFWMNILHNLSINSMYLSLFTFLISIIIISIGAGIYLVSDLPPNPIDYFMMSITTRFKVNITVAKILTESLGLLLGFIAGGPIGIGTFIMIVCFGPCIEIAYHQFHHLFRVLEAKIMI
ncbi:MAG: membrane protein [Erysipelotrichaceae bacterium]